MCRHIWKVKLAFLTSEYLILANKLPRLITDMIPLHEVKSFETITDVEFDDDELLAGRVPESLASLKSTSTPQTGLVKLHILTVLNGMNAGAHFVLRLQPGDCGNLVKTLKYHVEKVSSPLLSRLPRSALLFSPLSSHTPYQLILSLQPHSRRI